MRAVKLVFNNIENAFNQGSDMLARENMHNASTLAGMAFSNVSLGLAHSLAHKIGGEFGITHGLANAILLPHIVKYNKQFTDKYQEIEQYMGFDCLEDELRKLNAKLGIPLTLKAVTEVEIKEEEYMKVLDRMSQHAFDDPCTLTNPGTPSVEDIKEIYSNAYFQETLMPEATYLHAV